MVFDTLLGNQRLKDNLTATVRQGKLAHFYLISGPQGSGKHTLATILAAAAMCEQQDRPCRRCVACRKVFDGVHPDVIPVEDPTHKALPVKLVRQMRDDAFIRPNEGQRKIYIFQQEMGMEGQNALLKVLEEPPPYGMFLILTENAEKILPTVRSRCVELAMQRLEDELLLKTLRGEFPQADEQTLRAAVAQSGGFLGQARACLREGAQVAPETEAFIHALTEKDPLLLTRALVPLEKYKRDALIPLLQQWTQLAEGALAVRCGGTATHPLAAQLAKSRTAQQLNEMTALLQKCCRYAQANVSPAAVCAYLSWQLR